jgi:hypothetical protein
MKKIIISLLFVTLFPPLLVLSPASIFNAMPEAHVQFFTATILEWKQLLKQEKYKDIITTLSLASRECEAIEQPPA